jgi:membrane protease YdiL (CAAX protease family)
METSRGTAVFEIAALTVLVLSYMWLWHGAFPGHVAVLAVLLLTLLAWSHRRRGEGPAEIGFRLDNLAPALGQVALFLGPLAGLALLIGAVMDGFAFPPPAHWPVVLGWMCLWGLLQQYLLVGFYYRRFAEILPPGGPSFLAAALIFGVAHLPNPFLVILTPLLGVISCWLYRRVPNLYALGLAHGVLSFCIYYGLPRGLTYGLRVGPSFFGS